MIVIVITLTKTLANTWSPDKTSLLVESELIGRPNELVVMASIKTTVVQLTNIMYELLLLEKCSECH